MKKYYSYEELKTFFEKANLFVVKKEYTNAVDIISHLINNISPENPMLPIILDYRANIYTKMNEWDFAISDIEKSISINPDSDSNYLQMGVYITWKHFYTNRFRIDEKNKEIETAIKFYKECLIRDPTNVTAWLNIIETYLFLMDWDNALCHLGICKPYLSTKENRLIWTWLTCLSLALAGDSVEHSDIDLLKDETEYYKTNHDYKQIDNVLSELQRICFEPERLKMANEVHQLYKLRIGVQ